MTLWSSVSTWIELVAGVLLVISGAVRWFVADPPGPAWLRGRGSREVRRQRGRANVAFGVGLVLLAGGNFVNAADHPAVGAPMTLVAVVLIVASVVLNVRATKQERSEPPSE